MFDFVMGSDHLESCNNYNLSTSRRLPISHRMATSLLSGSRFDDDEKTLGIRKNLLEAKMYQVF